MIHIIIFSIIALALFTLTFFKLIKENNSNYLFALIPEFLGIFIDFICILNVTKPNIFVIILMYILSIFLPIIIMTLERREINILELINTAKVYYYESKNKKDEAKQILIKNIKKYPNSYLAHKHLAEWYEKNNELEKAEDEYIKVIEIKPNNFNDYIKVAKLYKQSDKKELEIKVLQELIRRKPDSLEGSLLLGEVLYTSEMFKEAINVYKQAVKHNPGEYELYYCLGMTYTRLNDFQNAMEYYKKAATINSVLNVAKLNLGQISLIFKEYDEAEKYFMECIETDDEKLQSEAYYYLAKIKIINGQKDLAIQYANIAVEINPKIIRKMEGDVYFTIILAKIKRQEDRKIDTKLNEKEDEVIKHLNKTYTVVEKLTQANIRQDEKEMEMERDQ